MQQQQLGPTPRLFQAAVDALSLPDLRAKLLFTLAMLIVFRFIAQVPVPGVNIDALSELFKGNALFGMLDMFSGGAMRNLSVAAMGVYPYITASIIMQLLIPVIPRLEALQREGEAGRNKLNQYTHWLTVPLALMQAYGLLVTLQRTEVNIGGVDTTVISGINLFSGDTLLFTIAMLLSMVAGTVFLIWIGQLITEKGIGNGISIIIFGGIISALPSNIWNSQQTAGWGGLIMLIILLVLITFFIVFVSEAVRRIPVQYSRSMFRGGRMYKQAGGTHIPMKVNSAGMIPLIFAFAILVFPSTVATYFMNKENEPANFANHIHNWFSPGEWVYWVLLFLLVVGFTFFYTVVIFQQQNLSEMLQRQGGFIPGIRPGKPTAEYLNKVMLRICWGGALFLAIIAVSPLFTRLFIGLPSDQAAALMLISSAGLLITVGVVLDTLRQIEAQLMMRQYEGFIK